MDNFSIEILLSKTQTEFNIDLSDVTPNTIENDSRAAFMRCKLCNEEFIRPVALISNGHMCNCNNITTEASFRAYLHGPKKLPRIECKLIDPLAKYPYRKRVTDAGHDIASIEDKIVPRLGMVNVRTGIIVVAPTGWYYTIEGRSSLWTKNIAPYHSIIDATYTGELCIALMNSSETDYCVKIGDRIAQIILHQVNNFDLVPVDEFSSDYCKRGTDGFGSSGR